MSAGLDTRPTATTLDLEELTRLAWSGQIRIPHFQRPLRWKRADVIRLFDSIVRGYPVGSFLLWRRAAAAERLLLGALSIDAPETAGSLWVVDGQQRITSLANALHPDGAKDSRFALAYDVKLRQFIPLPAVEEPAVIPLPVIFDLTRVLRWFTAHPEAVDYVDQANEITRTLRQFRIPVYEVIQDDPKVLQDIFDRMNSYGKRLSRAEIFSGLFAGEESKKDTTATLDRIAEKIDDSLEFGFIDNDTVLRAVLARRGPDVKRDIRNEFGEAEKVSPRRSNKPARAIMDFPDEDRDTAYALGEEAMRRAVRFLQNDAGVPHISLLPYRYLLVVLTRMFAHFPDPDSRGLVLLRRWLWRAAIVGPEVFRGSSTGAAHHLNFAIKPGNLEDSIFNLLKRVNRPETKLPDLRRFRSNEASTKIVLCSWWGRQPRSLSTGEPFERNDLAAILPDQQTVLDAVRYVVRRPDVRGAYHLRAANRILLPAVDEEGEPVDAMLMSGPERFSDEHWDAVLHSHCLDRDMIALLREGNIDSFMARRQEVLREQLDTFIRQRCEWDFEDTPSLNSLVIDDDESADEDSDDAF